MNPADRYAKIVEWSEEDQCFVGSCPGLFYGGRHGDDERALTWPMRLQKRCLVYELLLSTDSFELVSVRKIGLAPPATEGQVGDGQKQRTDQQHAPGMVAAGDGAAVGVQQRFHRGVETPACRGGDGL